jgi:predicted transcriptional regulator
MKSTTMTLRIPHELRDQLDRLAETTQRTRSSIGCEAIQRYLDMECGQAPAARRLASVADAGSFPASAGAAARKRTG